LTEATFLVPGFYNDARFLTSLGRGLERYGIATDIIAPQPSDGTAPLEELAAQLKSAVETTVSPDQPVNLFGFSMGGLICRFYLQRLGGLARTRRLVTLATPHRGTWMAYLFNRPGCFQMRPASEFLADLNSDLSALKRINFTTIWTPTDLTIVPAASSVLPVGKVIQILSPFHATLPMDPRIVRTVADELRKPLLATDTTTQV
jgi:triacylglycerol lipase